MDENIFKTLKLSLSYKHHEMEYQRLNFIHYEVFMLICCLFSKFQFLEILRKQSPPLLNWWRSLFKSEALFDQQHYYAFWKPQKEYFYSEDKGECRFWVDYLFFFFFEISFGSFYSFLKFHLFTFVLFWNFISTSIGVQNWQKKEDGLLMTNTTLIDIWCSTYDMYVFALDFIFCINISGHTFLGISVCWATVVVFRFHFRARTSIFE